MSKQIKISPEAHEQLEKLSARHQEDMKSLVSQMINFFFKSGQHPGVESDLAGEVLKLKNQLISFIRTQEKEKLNPLVDELSLLSKFVSQSLSNMAKTEEVKTVQKQVKDCQEAVIATGKNQMIFNKTQQSTNEKLDSLLAQLESVQSAKAKACKLFAEFKEESLKNMSNLGGFKTFSGMEERLKSFEKQFKNL